MTILLDSASFNKWHTLINAHEECRLIRSKEGNYLLNGVRIRRYTFKQDYFLVLNDHQGFLNDSRTFGLVPASHIIGRALFTLFSPKEKRFLEINKQ
jgi:signal peptidase I